MFISNKNFNISKTILIIKTNSLKNGFLKGCKIFFLMTFLHLYLFENTNMLFDFFQSENNLNLLVLIWAIKMIAQIMIEYIL